MTAKAGQRDFIHETGLDLGGNTLHLEQEHTKNPCAVWIHKQ